MTELPLTGRLAGIDHGKVRIGVSICDPAQSLASPYENYQRRGERQDSVFFQHLAREERLVGWVVGLPLHMSGDESEQSKLARKFAQWLTSETGLPHHLYDERCTSALADEMLSSGNLTAKQRKQRRDMLAAQVILASYLESGRASDGGGALSD